MLKRSRTWCVFRSNCKQIYDINCRRGRVDCAARRHVQHKARPGTLGSWGIAAHMPEYAKWMQNGTHSHYSYEFAANLFRVLLSLVSAHSVKMWRKYYLHKNALFLLMYADIWKRTRHFDRWASFGYERITSRWQRAKQCAIRTKKTALESGLVAVRAVSQFCIWFCFSLGFDGNSGCANTIDMKKMSMHTMSAQWNYAWWMVMLSLFQLQPDDDIKLWCFPFTYWNGVDNNIDVTGRPKKSPVF